MWIILVGCTSTPLVGSVLIKFASAIHLPKGHLFPKRYRSPWETLKGASTYPLVAYLHGHFVMDIQIIVTQIIVTLHYSTVAYATLHYIA